MRPAGPRSFRRCAASPRRRADGFLIDPRQRPGKARLAFALCLSLAAAARAEDPLNSSNKPTNGDQAEAAPGAKKKEPHDEFNLLPVAGGSTDIGFGGGFFAGFAHLAPGFDPYVWNIESSGLITFKGTDGGGVAVPYTDIYAKLTIPRFLGLPLRFEVRPSYTSESTVHYYGLGNASSTKVPAGKPGSFTEYGRTHPQLDLDLRFKIVDHFAGRAGLRFVQNFLQANPDSTLVADQQGGSDEVKHLLGPIKSHGVLLLKVGLQADNRDNEASTHEGSLHTLDFKLSPGGGGEFPYRYGEATFNTRVFVPLWKPRLTLATRIVGNVLFGDVPFYELPRFDDTYALGGSLGVRGIPAQRYYGKVKLFGNVELRSELVSFRALDKPLVFGVVGFFDAGRLWADTSPHPELDGSGLGLHYGAGGGLRLQSGSAFVLRADLAYSPDADPIGGYFSAGQQF